MNVLVEEFLRTLQEFAGDDHRGGGAVSDLVVLGLGHFHHHLGGRVLDIHLLENGDTVVGDDHVADAVHEHLVHALGSKGCPYCTCNRLRGGDVHALGVTPAGP